MHGTQLEVKTATPTNTTFKVQGTRDNKTAAIAGDVEAKYTNKAHGLVFTQAWTTANVLKSQVELENYFAKGLKLDVTSALVPDKNTKSAIVNATYKQPGLHSRASLDLFKVGCRSCSASLLACLVCSVLTAVCVQGPTFTADSVIGRDGFLVGAEASYNVTEGRITQYATALGYSAPEYALTLHGLKNLNVFAASYYHRVSPDVEAGAKAIYDTKSHGNVSLEVGTKVYVQAH